jgi:predicted ester cyclase
MDPVRAPLFSADGRRPLSRRGALARLGAAGAGLALAGRALPAAAQEPSAEANEGLVKQLYAAANAGTWDALAAVVATDAVDHDAVPGQAPGLAGITQRLMALKAAFAGDVVVDELVSEGEWVTDRVHLDGTHTGPFFGIAATGKPVHLEAIEMWKTREGKLVEGWHVETLLQVLVQIGAIPAPGVGPAASPAASPPA